MQLGMIGLGRMGANMVKRLLQAGHDCVVYDRDSSAVSALSEIGARGTANLAEFIAALPSPRTVWLMLPAAVVESALDELEPLLAAGDTLIDGGNSYYKDDIRRAARFAERGIAYLDIGTSGGVWGLERGYCLMIGGEQDAFIRNRPIFSALAPGLGDIPRTAGREAEPADAEQGFLYCGPAGAGHFVKMVHNGIEYGLMAAYAEGFNLLKHADVGLREHSQDAETSPLHDPAALQYRLPVGDIAELWRRGSVVSSWLLDLSAKALLHNEELSRFGGQVSDSGEGRWTNIAAIEAGVPAPVLSAALFSRFSSRGEDEYANKILSAMRFEFGGHEEKK